MPKHLQKELAKLKKRILSLGTMAEERFRMAMRAMDKRDASLAEEIIKLDYEIDELEVEIEEECLKVLALHQPVAIDLRFLVAVLKINNDLERIGDLAVNVAERAAFLAVHKQAEIPFDFPTMSELVKSMLNK